MPLDGRDHGDEGLLAPVPPPQLLTLPAHCTPGKCRTRASISQALGTCRLFWKVPSFMLRGRHDSQKQLPSRS